MQTQDRFILLAGAAGRLHLCQSCSVSLSVLQFSPSLTCCSVSLPILLFWSAHLASHYHVFTSMWLIALSCPLLQETLSYHQRLLKVLCFARYAFAQNPCRPKSHFMHLIYHFFSLRCSSRRASPLVYFVDHGSSRAEVAVSGCMTYWPSPPPHRRAARRGYKAHVSIKCPEEEKLGSEHRPVTNTTAVSLRDLHIAPSKLNTHSRSYNQLFLVGNSGYSQTTGPLPSILFKGFFI